VVAVDVFKPNVLEPVVSRGTLLDEDWVERLEQEGIERVKVRSAISCESRYGICAKCYGRDLGRGHLVNIGEAVVAAQSIGEPGTQLTMRTPAVGTFLWKQRLSRRTHFGTFIIGFPAYGVD